MHIMSYLSWSSRPGKHYKGPRGEGMAQHWLFQNIPQTIPPLTVTTEKGQPFWQVHTKSLAENNHSEQYCYLVIFFVCKWGFWKLTNFWNLTKMKTICHDLLVVDSKINLNLEIQDTLAPIPSYKVSETGSRAHKAGLIIYLTTHNLSTTVPVIAIHIILTFYDFILKSSLCNILK